MDITESKTPIVILSYHNCEIYCCHLDGYKTNIPALLNRLAEIEQIFLAKPNHAKFRVWYNIDDDSLDIQTIQLIAESIFRFQSHIHKIAFIGLHGRAKRKFNGVLTQIFKATDICKEYFTDAESAKGWLV